MKIATSPPHHVLVVSDSLDLALIRTALSTKANLLLRELSPGFGAGVKCEKTKDVTMHLLFSVVVLLQMCRPVLSTTSCSTAERINIKKMK